MGIGRANNQSQGRATRAIVQQATWVLALSLIVGGCRTTEADVHRWATTTQGPDRLTAVVAHDKYPAELRIEAARTLIDMHPRNGQRVGIPKLVETLEQMPDAEASALVDGLVPILLEELKQPAKIDGDRRIDDSVAFKDAAYALLSADGESRVADPEDRKALRTALREWIQADFAARVDDPTQSFGVEQVLRYLGKEGVRGMHELLTADADKSNRVVGLIADLADPEEKRAAADRLVARSRHIDSNKWLKEQAPLLRQQNRKAKLAPTKAQFQKQLSAFQEEQLMKAYATMRRIGQAPIVEYLISEAENETLDDKRRATALAALEDNLDPNNTAQIRRVLKLAGADSTPDAVRDVALRRVSELPRKLVIEDLYALFDSERWKVRWVAAEAALKMSEQSHLDEFMKRLGEVRHMAITEPLRYGALLGQLKGEKSGLFLAKKYADTDYPPPVRVSALGYFYQHGTPSQLELVEPYADDRTDVPGCPKDADDCEWQCRVGGEVREIETIGQFVQSCVKPAMQARKQTKPPQKRSNKKESVTR